MAIEDLAAQVADGLQARRLVLFGINPRADGPAKGKRRRDPARDVAILGSACAMRGRLRVLHEPTPAAAPLGGFAVLDGLGHCAPLEGPQACAAA